MSVIPQTGGRGGSLGSRPALHGEDGWAALGILASGHEGDGQEAGLAGDAEPRPQARWALSPARALGLCTHTLHPTRSTDIFVVKIFKTPFKVFGHWQCIS